tara:strand:- start:1321 stop:1755 length:435 start_codon:yes stop_codon:yes gene_type:complete
MAISFKNSSGIDLSPFSFSGRTSNPAAYGNVVSVGANYKGNRANAFDPSAYIAQNMASKALGQSAVMESESGAYTDSLSAINYVNQAKKEAKRIEDAAKKKASKGIFGSALGAVVGLGATALTGNPMVGMAAAQGGKALGTAIG